jgi:hypothetical protein
MDNLQQRPEHAYARISSVTLQTLLEVEKYLEPSFRENLSTYFAQCISSR